MSKPWSVDLWKHGELQSTAMVPYLGAHLIVPMAHRSVGWFTKAVYVVTGCSRDDHKAVAEYSHMEKPKLDRPRDPRRFPV